MKDVRSMSYGELVALKAKIEVTLRRRDAKERRELAKMVAAVGALSAHRAASSKGRNHALKGRKLKPKYRNPTDRTQTWAGRGLQPRWLSAQLKRGKKLTAFLIK